MKGLKKYFNHRREKIISVLQQITPKNDPEDFHKLRTEIKKLNALLHLIKFCSPGIKRKKLFRPFQLVFYQAGKIRELQLEEEYLEKNAPQDFLPGYKQRLQSLRVQHEIVFLGLFNSGIIDQLDNQFERISSHLPDIHTDKANHYLEEKRIEIVNLIRQNNMHPQQVHELRKKIKSYQNILECIAHGDESGTISQSTELTKLLGDWHDLQVILCHLSQVKETDSLSPFEVGQLNEVMERTITKADMLLHQIYMALLTGKYFQTPCMVE